MREPNKRKKIKYVVMTTAIISYAGLLLQQKLLQKHRHSHRKPHIDRKRAKVVNIRRCLGRTYFRRAYRMGQDKFDELAKLLEPFIRSKRRVGPNGIIPFDLELSIALRYFAGGSPLDFIASHGISHSSIWNIIWRIVNAINKCNELQIRFPTDHSIQRQISAAFKEKSAVGFDNCVGCIDGLLICTEKPTEKFANMMKTGSRAFYCGRKSRFGYNMQAVCDAEGRFLSVCINHPASASDFISFMRSKFYTKLTTPGFLADGLVIFGDNAYVSTDYMVTPYKNVRAGPKDDFNFFHSQLRINIERAFGMLVKKWGVLQKPLPCRMGPTKQLALVMALCRLHNFCLGDDGQPENSRSVPANSNDLGNSTGAANAATIESENGNIISSMTEGGEHFEDVLDEELVAEQSSRVRLAMRKRVEESGLHRSVISLNNRNTNN
jgi:hypothetical protein